MLEIFLQSVGLVDDARAILKAGISKLLGIFFFYLTVHLWIAYRYHQWMFVGHTIWMLFGFYLAWFFMWRVANKATDALIVAGLGGNEYAQYLIERARRLLVVIVIAGHGFYFFPTYESFSLTLGIIGSFLIYALTSPGWHWNRWYKFSIYSMGFQAVGILLKALDFQSFLDDPRYGLHSFPLKPVVALVLLIVIFSAIPTKETVKEKEHGHH